MPTPNPRQQKILNLFLKKGVMASSSVHKFLRESGEKISVVSVKRELSVMTKNECLKSHGAGRSTTYAISPLGRILSEVDAQEYSFSEPDKRYGQNVFNADLFAALPHELFSGEQLKNLEGLTLQYRKRSKGSSAIIQKKELERLIIELAWKSSRIEGNTYTLLDTERLILENQEARGHDKSEALMILNHKKAFQFIHERRQLFRTMTRANLDELHGYLVRDLGVSRGFRKKAVGVTGSLYRPLENQFHIKEAVEKLCAAVARQRSPYSKALTALLGISYIQPFEDGNKRTSRLMANAILLAHHCAPLSYRSVDEEEYRNAVLVFYELNSMMPFRKIFLAQYEFAARHYSVS